MNENDPDGPVEVKEILAVFTSYDYILEIHVGGRVIRSTREHPIWVRGKGWTPANKLEPGDEVLSHDKIWTKIEKIVDNGKQSRVYNVCVADHHTYFVGGDDWGFDVWAHNASIQQQGKAFEARARAWARSRGERTLVTPRGRNRNNGFDFISWTGSGKKARLIINEVKDVNGRVSSRSMSALGFNNRRTVDLNRGAAARAINRAVGKGRIDRATAEALIEQLYDRTARVRLIGNQNTDFSGVRSLVVDYSGFRTLPGRAGAVPL